MIAIPSTRNPRSVPGRLRVACVNKTYRPDIHERIESIGGLTESGSEWKLPAAEAIRGIKRQKWSFYVEEPAGERVGLIVAVHRGHEYLKTEVDGEQPDNLLALPECPRY